MNETSYLNLYKNAYHMDDPEALKALFTETMLLIKTPEKISDLQLKCLPNVMALIGTATSKNTKNVPSEYKEYASGTWNIVQNEATTNYFAALELQHEKLAEISQKIKEENSSQNSNYWLYSTKNWLLSATFAPSSFYPWNGAPFQPHAVKFIENNPAIFQDFLEQKVFSSGWKYLLTMVGNVGEKESIFYDKENILLHRMRNDHERKMLLIQFQEDGLAKKAFYTDVKTGLNDRVVTDHINSGKSRFSDNATTGIIEQAMPVIVQCQQKILAAR